MNGNKLLTLKQVKERIPLSYRKLRELCVLKTLKAKKEGRNWLVKERSVEYYVNF